MIARSGFPLEAHPGAVRGQPPAACNPRGPSRQSDTAIQRALLQLPAPGFSRSRNRPRGRVPRRGVSLGTLDHWKLALLRRRAHSLSNARDRRRIGPSRDELIERFPVFGSPKGVRRHIECVDTDHQH
jgi:hypothetical protein